MSAFDLDARLARAAHRREGTFSRTQATSLGFTDKMIETRLDSRRWVRLEADVFVLPGYPGTLLRQCWAAHLGAPGSAVAGLAAAKLLDLPGIGAGRAEIVVPPASNSRSGLAVVHRYDGPLITRLRGLPITTMAQTLFDVAPRVGVDRLERVADNSILTGRLTVDELDERLNFYKGTRRAGLPVMRELIRERRAEGWVPPDSELERQADRIMRRLRNATVEPQARFPWLKRGRGRVDRLVDGLVLVEFDGRRWHARVKDFDHDRWRDNLAVANGLRPLRFTFVHVTTRPREVLDVIEQTRRAAHRAA